MPCGLKKADLRSVTLTTYLAAFRKPELHWNTQSLCPHDREPSPIWLAILLLLFDCIAISRPRDTGTETDLRQILNSSNRFGAMQQTLSEAAAHALQSASEQSELQTEPLRYRKLRLVLRKHRSSILFLPRFNYAR